MRGGGSEARVIVVTGANRGIGRAVAGLLATRGDTVVLGSRSLGNGERAARELSANCAGRVVARELDVTDAGSVDALAAWAGAAYGRVDGLVNNAAIHYDSWQSAAGADLVTVGEALSTNLIGAWRVTLSLLPLLRASRSARIVNVSSEAGSLAGMGGGTPAYRVSKAGLNALTRMLAAELAASGILVNSVCPGWVATDLDGPGGRPAAEAAAGVLWALDLPADGPNGGFFRDGRPLPW